MCKKLAQMHAKSLAKLTEGWGLVSFICSIFAGIPCICVGIFHKSDCWNNVLVGLLMLVLGPVFFVGVVWSLYWGYQIWKISKKCVETSTSVIPLKENPFLPEI